MCVWRVCVCVACVCVCVCVCVNINCLCCSMGTAVVCVVVCGHDLFVSVVLIDVRVLCVCVHVCSRAGTFASFHGWSLEFYKKKNLAPLVIPVWIHVTQFVVCAFFSIKVI